MTRVGTHYPFSQPLQLRALPIFMDVTWVRWTWSNGQELHGRADFAQQLHLNWLTATLSKVYP